jgi:hypothetical protein
MGVAAAHRPYTDLGAGGYPTEADLVISEVPEEWRRHAREPWRILFPDLDWQAPGQD